MDPREVVGDDIDVEVFAHDRAPTREELIAGARGAQGIVTLLSDRVDGALLDALPEVRVVANHAVGIDNVDVAACTARKVWVTNTPDVLTEATADLTWTLILAVARRVREGERMVREWKFGGWSPTMLLGMELNGATLGVFGMGRIGQAVARREMAFGMNVIWCGGQALGLTKEELCAAADVISIHAPLTKLTRHAFGGVEFGLMKQGAILINTARGPIVDEAALVRALEKGQLGGAGLDVYEDEPKVHPGLVGRDDVVLLPHVGSATWAARGQMAELALEDAERVLRGERPLHPVNEVEP